MNPSELAFKGSSPLSPVLRTQPFSMAVLSLERFLITPLNVFTSRSRSVFSSSSRLANRLGAAARVQSNILLGISGRAWVQRRSPGTVTVRIRIFSYPVYPVNPVKNSFMRFPRSLRHERPLGSGREILIHAFSTSRYLSGSRRAKIVAPGHGATSFFLCSSPRT